MSRCAPYLGCADRPRARPHGANVAHRYRRKITSNLWYKRSAQIKNRRPVVRDRLRQIKISVVIPPQKNLYYRDAKLSLIHISEPTRQAEISYAVFCLKK